MGIVIQLASGSSGPVPPLSLDGHSEFTRRDLADLAEWSTHDCRVSLCSSEIGNFAMLYQKEMPWASWGVVRQGRMVLLWDCVTLADIGRFPSMFDAISALPMARRAISVPSILPFAANHEICSVSL